MQVADPCNRCQRGKVIGQNTDNSADPAQSAEATLADAIIVHVAAVVFNLRNYLPFPRW
jgi:hypothetical protein